MSHSSSKHGKVIKNQYDSKDIYFPCMQCWVNRARLARYIFRGSWLFLFVWTYAFITYTYRVSLTTLLYLPVDGIVWIIFLSLYIISSLRASFTSPGTVDQTLYNNDNDVEMQNLLPHNNNIASNRPPKSHFSFELQCNVLRMDHFCLWINNVVGLYNYKYFILAVLYTFIECNYTLLLLLYRHYIPIESSVPPLTGWTRTFCFYYIIVMSLLFWIFSIVLLRFHLRQISCNLTSIEYRIFQAQRSKARSFNIRWHNVHQYDYGLYNNWIAMLGKDWFLWLLPTKPYLIEDGYKYKINEKNKEIIDEFNKLCEIAKKKPLSRKYTAKYLSLLTEKPICRHTAS